MAGAVGSMVVIVVGGLVALLVFLALRELWCWVLKLTAIHEELQVVSAYLKAINEREAQRDERTRANAEQSSMSGALWETRR